MVCDSEQVVRGFHVTQPIAGGESECQRCLYYRSASGTDATVTLANPGDTLAFFIEMEIAGAESHTALLPVLWDDNYVSLPPHTTKTFHAHFPNGEKPELKLQGWNVKFERFSAIR